MTAAMTEVLPMDSRITGAAKQSPWFTAARITLLSALMLAPLAFGAVQPWAWAGLCVMSGVALMLWAVGCARGGCIRLMASPMYAIIALAFMLVAGQLLWCRTADPIGTREALIKLTAYATIFFLAGQLTAGLSESGWRCLGLGILAYVFAMAAFAILQFFSNPQLIYWSVRPRWGGYVFGPYVNHNHYAGLLEVLLPLAVGALLASSERHALRLLGGFAVLLGLASVLLCGSRGGGIAMIAELAILFAIIVFCAPVENGRTMILSALAVTALAVGLFAWLDPGSVFKRWQSTASSPEVAAGVRPVMVADSLRMLRRNPVTGVGAGAYEVAYSRYQSWITDVAVDHAHNDYAELLAETGVCGGLLLIAFLAMFFIRMVSGLSERGGAGLIRIGAAIACCGFLLHGFTDFNFHIPANAAWFSAAAGVAVLGIRPSVRPASRTF